MSSFGIRMMGEADIEETTRLESRLSPSPWSEQNFSDCLRHQYLCLLAAAPNHVLGFCVVSIAAGEAQILNIGVQDSRHRSGVGSALLNDAIARCTAEDVLEVFLEVRESNKGAIAFYEHHDFKKVGVRKDYYKGVLTPGNIDAASANRENAIIMRRDL